jgi:glycyl-tRNA synthetase
MHENPASLSEQQIGKLLKENDVRCAVCGGDLTTPRRFNLMFKTQVGAGKGKIAYLRPETAQGMFVNFAQIHRYGREKLPVGAIQVGRSFRNEISPRQGLIRLREFSMMEAELFVHPESKTWPKFGAVKDEDLSLVPSTSPPRIMKLGDAVKSRIIANETLAYFMWLTFKFAVDIGLDPRRLRFRQHAKTEMAHYAADCWDPEAEIGYGWIEMVGVADRGSYDVQAHITHSGADLTAFERFEEPKEIERKVVRPVYGALGPLFKGDAKQVAEAISRHSPDAVRGRDTVEVEVAGKKVDVPKSCYEVTTKKEKVSGRKFVPHVVEPSYGVDRILYAVLDHAYSKKDDYVTLKLRPSMAPVKAGVFPLMPKDGLDEIAEGIYADLARAGITAYYDDSGSIGRRYARMDEIGTPCCVTVDFDTKNDSRVTLRDRDSAEQVRINKAGVVAAVEAIVSGKNLRDVHKMQ